MARSARSIAASVVGASFSASAASRTPHGQPRECRWTTLAVRSVASTSCRASTSATWGTSIASSEPATLVSWPATWCRWISIAGSPWLRRTRRSPRIARSRTTSRSRPSCPTWPEGKSSSTTTHGPLRRRSAPNTVSACRLRRSWEPTSGIGMTCRSPASTRASCRSVQKRSGSATGPPTFIQISPPGSSEVVAHSATAWVLPHPVGAVTNVSRPDTPRSSRSTTRGRATTQGGTGGSTLGERARVGRSSESMACVMSALTSTGSGSLPFLTLGG